MKKLFMILTMLSLIFGSFTKVHADETTLPDFNVTARDFFNELEPAITAGGYTILDKYIFKTFHITGEIKDNVIDDNSHRITLKADDDWGAVYCEVRPAASNEVAKLKKGEIVTLQAISVGWLVGPSFQDCFVVKNNPASGL